MEREANICYLAKRRVRITTPLQQKEFDLDKISPDHLIDLVSVSIIHESKMREMDVGFVFDPYDGGLAMKQAPSRHWETIGRACFDEFIYAYPSGPQEYEIREGVFKVRLWET